MEIIKMKNILLILIIFLYSILSYGQQIGGSQIKIDATLSVTGTNQLHVVSGGIGPTGATGATGSNGSVGATGPTGSTEAFHH